MSLGQPRDKEVMNKWKTQVFAVMSASAVTTWKAANVICREITVTERCTCSSQQVDIPHYCQSYEKK